MKKINDIDIAEYFYPIKNQPDDFDIIIEFIADSSLVLMGEATHGTHEFYKTRIELTKRLILEKGFNTIAIEGDFPDAYRINRYINFQGSDKSSKESLSDFKRFPAWMWRNEEMITFIDWLYTFNKSQPKNKRVSFYGLDLYSLTKSVAVIIDTLEKIDPKEAQKARKHYKCFDLYQDAQEYGYFASNFADKSCRDEVIAQLKEMKQKDVDFFKYDNLDPLEEKFYVDQNALVVKNAELYYRSLFNTSGSFSWNIRDKHMMETAMQIEKYNHAAQRGHKMVVWAHNSHVGDARATQMASYAELNLGQLAKEYYGSQAISIGFTTYTGTVSAASAWGGNVERKYVRPALDTSIEAFFHSVGLKNFIVIPKKDPALYNLFDHDDYLERAIGVIYLPESERQSHYFYAQLSKQFDVIIHYDITHAIKPLDITTEWKKGEENMPETFPFGV